MKRGWCPTVHEPMPTGDGLLVRVKPRFSRLSAAQAHLVACQAVSCGNGIIELTSRGNLQIRGLNAASAPVFAAAMSDAGLASADAGLERRRNVTVSPLAGADPQAAGDTLVLAAAMEDMLAQDGSLSALPAKFNIAVDGGGALPLSVQADLVLRTDGQHLWVNDMPVAGRLDAAVAHARAAIGGRPATTANGPNAIAGFVGYHGAEDGAFAIGLPFGQIDASCLASLADLAMGFADGILRLSPWRAVLLGTVRKADVPALADAASRLGLIADPADRRLHMAACIGSAGCASGTVRARDDAATLARLGWTGTFLHVSGCLKGCAHPGPATRTLVGESGRYNVVREGRAADRPEATCLTLAQAGAL